MDEKAVKVTYSYDGKTMPVKELNLNDTKLINPLIFIKEDGREGINSSLSQRTISTRQTRTRFNPKKNIVAQFESNLEAIYDEQANRDAKDNDSNFSAESYERRKRIEEEENKIIISANDDQKGSNLAAAKSHLSGKLSKLTA